MIEGHFDSLENPAEAGKKVYSRHPLGKIAPPIDIANATLLLADGLFILYLLQRGLGIHRR
jgi:hypothetical protein